MSSIDFVFLLSKQDKEEIRYPEIRKRRLLKIPIVQKAPCTEGAEAAKRGALNEARFGVICSAFLAKGDFPSWLSEVVAATPTEQSQGVDYIALTLEGLHIRLNVKSSEKALKRGRCKNRKQPERQDIILIIVNNYRNDDEIFSEFIGMISEARTALIEKRTAQG